MASAALSDRLVVMTDYHADVFWWNSAAQDLSVTTVEYLRRPTTIAFHPTEEYIAIGETSGKITLMYYKTGVKTILHWHAHPVRCMAFSSDGGYLFTGAAEGVMVLWQIGTTGKQFLAHLGSPLEGITCNADETLFALKLASGDVKIVTSIGLETKCIIKGQIQNQSTTAEVTVQPNTGHLVTNASPGQLHFYNTRTGQFVDSLAIVPYNYLASTTSRDEELIPPSIDHVAFSAVGAWLMTVDSRASVTQELKFWEYSSETKRYTLNTRLESVHQGGITGVAFQPSTNQKHKAWTCGRDGNVRLWSVERKRGGFYWIGKSAAYYKTFIPRSLSISTDGSFFVVVYDDFCTLWNPLTMSVIKVLAFDVPKGCMRTAFVNASRPYLVAYGNKLLQVWDLLTGQTTYSFQVDVRFLQVDHDTDKFVVCMQDDRNQCIVAIFAPDNARPLHFKPFKTTIRALVGIPRPISAQVDSVLRMDMAYVDENGSCAFLYGGDELAPVQDSEPAYLSGVFGQPETKPTAALQPSKLSNGHMPVDLSAPAHLIPSIDQLFMQFMDAHLIKKH
jgi:WD40 repeat protein